MKINKFFAVFSAALILLSSVCVSASGVYSTESAQILVKNMGIMTGDENGNMNLSDNVTRAQFAKMTVNASKYKNSVALGAAVSVFRDCSYTHWAAPYVRVAVVNKILTGYTDGTFKPDNPVTYEEAVTVALRLLGYDDSDFGNSWPYGQVGLAVNLGLSDNIDNASVGSCLTRKDVMTLIYNLLTTNSKGSDKEYISQLDASFYEDAVIIATNNEDTSVGADSVYTSVGTFKTGSLFDSSCVGQKGDLAVKSTGEILAFMPYSQKNEKYVVYSVVGNTVAAYKGGNLTELSVSDNTTVYSGTDKLTFAASRGDMSTGDIIHVVRDSKGSVEYLTLTKDAMEGPYTLSVYSDNWYSQFGGGDITVMRDGTRVPTSEVKQYDILYWSPDMNIVFAYSKKITGVYESASPNKDTPETVTVSGTKYSIESVRAFDKLSSNGSLNYGDTVTLLFGKDGEIADVIDANNKSNSSDSVGYLVKTGTKAFENSNGEKYTSVYADLILPDGSEAEYVTDKDYSSYVNSVMRIGFSNGVAKLNVIKNEQDVSGKVSASAMTIGKNIVSSDVKILDVSTNDSSHSGYAVPTYMARIDGITLSQSAVMWCKKNSKGEICELILCDVTGDSAKYGIVKSAPSGVDGGSTYVINVDGDDMNFSGGYFGNIRASSSVKAEYSGTNIQRLTALKSTGSRITKVTDTAVTCGNTDYTLSDKVIVYKNSGDYTYTVIPLSELADMISDSYAVAYYDKAEKDGGRIRVITVR